MYDCLGRYSLRNNGSVFRHLPYKQFHKNCSYLLLLEKPLPVVVFSHKRLHPYQLFPADYCSSAGTGTLLKSRQFFNGNCQTPMGNGWIRTNVNGFKNHFFVTDFALSMDTAGYAPATASYELAVLLLN